jgi:peptidylprolyl isomerase/peptidyl-prolyl cis-trans isomerase B (cyclophilin B)
MKKIILFLFLLNALIILPGCTTRVENEAKLSNEGEKVEQLKFPGVLPDDLIKNKKAVITTNKGVIEFTLYTDKAPKTVSNFVYLAQKGYYNNLTFHRVVSSFVIQGGDPKGNGTGGPGYEFEDEAVQGDYLAGTVAMANSGANTNGSQFFICLEDQPDLPKQYNLFGQVTAGMDIVKQIQVGDKMEKVEIQNN